MSRIHGIIISYVIFCLTAIAWAGPSFPDIQVANQLSVEDMAYLGLSQEKGRLSDIDAEYLFVEAYSMYCPICQRDAPRVNELYADLKKVDPDGKVKFLGIAFGNTAYEVSFYQKKFNVPFPLLIDADYDIHKALHEVGTPIFYLVKLGSSPEIVFMNEGDLVDEGALLESIKSHVGL